MKTKKTPVKLYNVYAQTSIVLALGLWLLFNLIASQLMSPLYFNLVNENRLAAASYLKHIQALPQFLTELDKYRQIYGANIANSVFADKRQETQEINKYEAALQKNPESVTALYNLSLLYREAGNQQKAEEYLDKAKELDPNIR